MRNQNFKFILDRVANAPQNFRDDIEAAAGIAERFAARAATIKDDNRLTHEGRMEATREMWKKEFEGHFSQLQGSAKMARETIAAQRAACVPKSPDRADLFGEMQRAELRTMLRSLPPDRRFAYMATKDAAIRDAIVLASPALSGFSPDQHAYLVKQSVESEHGAKIQGLDQIEEYVGNVNAAIQIAGMDINRIAETTVVGAPA